MRKDFSKLFLLLACLIALFALSGCLKSILREPTTESVPEITEQTTQSASPTPTETVADTEPSTTLEVPVEPLAADRIVFEQSPLGNGYYDLYTIKADGGDVRTLTNIESASEFCSVVSPDGTKIAFVSNMSSTYEIYVINPDGTGLMCLTDEDCFPKQLFFSPDSKTIFYHAYVDGFSHVASVSVDGTHKKILKPGFFNIDYMVLDISPDGKQIAFVSDHEGVFAIYLMGVDGSNLTWLANGMNPCFSPDGKQIYFSDGVSILVMDSDGQNIRSLAKNIPQGSVFPVPIVSPDGTKIMFSTDAIYIMNTDGSDLTALTNIDAKNRYFPSFSPDGTRIVFASLVDEFTEIFMVNIDGTGLTQLINSQGFSDRPSFSPIMPTQGPS